MCNATVRDGQTSERLRGRLDIESISEAVRTGRLCLFKHAERKNENDCFKSVKHLELEGSTNDRGRHGIKFSRWINKQEKL